jgi:hypothetical protein
MNPALSAGMISFSRRSAKSAADAVCALDGDDLARIAVDWEIGNPVAVVVARLHAS